MAATAAGRVLTLCRQFQVGLRISSALPIKQPALSFSGSTICPLRQTSSLFAQKHVGIAAQCRSLHTSQCKMGLDEFFDIPENWGETTVKSGAPWTAKQLRTKSNEDLHKLWYVLLKERNMLLTVEQESKRQRRSMPSPERLRKVERSMLRLDSVVKEREDAIRLLQTGQEHARPGAWRRNIFGKTYWYKFTEHQIPWYLNQRYKRKRFYTPLFVNPFIRLRLEQYLRHKTRKDRAERGRQRKLKVKISQQQSAKA
ncbi:39S ribosomal protein L47, mitochondrial [Anguilla rostrata]|uniref:39S ribosomal protein L47, mitochondrial n=1 Tax=Anguilla rostrata TaxID=7938 RepID=UPI0030D26407